MAERGLMMALHALIIGIIMYGIFMFMGTEQSKAENRSIAVASFALLYMVLFGHGLPNKLNTDL